MAMQALATVVVTVMIAGASMATPGVAAEVEALFAELRVQRPATPSPAPALALPDLAGRTVRLRDLQGSVVLLSFFTTT